VIKSARAQKKYEHIMGTLKPLQEVANGKLTQVLPSWGMSDVDVYALCPKHRLKLPKVKAFVDFIQAVFKQRLIN
jgi:LysR family transcriptional regulator AphB